MTQEIPTICDEELAGQTKAGSLVAFEQLVYRYEHRIYSFVSQFCPNATDARDVTQDTFVKAFQKIGQYDSRRAFAAWLFTIARRKCIDRHRAAPRLSEESIPELTDDGDPSQLMANREEAQNLWRLARRRLSENQFQALWLHYAEDLEVAQIAQVLGKTRIHVKVILFRARQILGGELTRSSDIPSVSASVSPSHPLAVLANQPATRPPAQ